jgi:polar amino acid transport system permease protein
MQQLIHTFFNWPVFVESLPFLLSGLLVMIRIGFTSIVFGLVGGLALALVKLYAPRPGKALAQIYIDVYRSIPLLVYLFIVYYALPFVGIRLSAFWATTVALGMVSSAYAAEIFRAGIEAVPKGQFEASSALGLGFFDTMRDVVLPQAIKIVIPPMTGNCVNVLKDTALASVVALPELLKQAMQAQALAANPTPLIGAAGLYLLLLWPLVRLVAYFERLYGAQKR